MQNNAFLKELKDHIGKETKLAIVTKEKYKDYFYVYGVIEDVDSETVLMRTKRGIQRIAVDDVREVQETKLNYKDTGGA